MNIEAAEEHLVIVSDLHLGNPASSARTRLVAFLDHIRDTGASVCINGDGFDILQTSFSRLAGDAIPVINRLKALRADGRNIYYVVGNHDIVLEHFLEEWSLCRLSPFLNLRSGDRRIRIEHGHLYDPFFARSPTLYGIATHLSRYALFAVPDIYALWSNAQRRLQDARHRRVSRAGTVDDNGHRYISFVGSPYHEVTLPEGLYLNSGNWLSGATYVEITNGELAVRSWKNPPSHDNGQAGLLESS
ncbi:MAG: metallophosphoesterase [Actinomycetota bacterium]|nr:metallophosphoesterase [Actinomycetota bacterium]